MDPLEELRLLLLRREREQLGELQQRLDDKERRIRELSGLLPQAIKLSRDRGADLSRALGPSVEETLHATLERKPEIFVESLAPLIGSIVRRSIAESLRGLVQSINKTLEHTFSAQGLKWRYEAARTGRSFAEVVLSRSMIYRVEQLFLIHRETSLTLLHLSAAEGGADSDSDLVAGMLSAIRDFARDALRAGADDSLDEFRIGDLECWVASGRHAYLAAAIRGTPPRELRTILEEGIENVHLLKGPELARFNGDAAPFEPLRPELENCLRAQYRQAQPATGPGQYVRAFLAAVSVVALLAFAVALAWNAEHRWQDFNRRLNAEPGVAVTSSRLHWWRHSQVTGLRDPLAADPAPLARAAGLDPGKINYAWKNYLALDPVSIRRRFEQRFPPAAATRLDFRAGGTLTVSGTAPYEWAELVRREGTEIPGVTRLDDQKLEITYDPALVLARFRAVYSPPPTVVMANLGPDGTLHLGGSAPYEWIVTVHEGVARLPGIKAVSDDRLTVIYDPALVLDRFTKRFGTPETINTSVSPDGTLVLAGEASHPWLSRVRTVAKETPGIKAIDDKGAVDLDRQAFQQSKSVIESANVYFLTGKDNFATEGFAALSRLPDEIRRCQSAARHLGLDLEVGLFGTADAMGPEGKNLDLSQRRANTVRDFLVTCGLDASLFKPTGTGAPAPAPAATLTVAGKPPTAEQSQRRVAFRVGTRVSSPPQ